ncbi:MAG: hypothetical protein ACRDNR_15370 [Gaiellaceae bacterium]
MASDGRGTEDVRRDITAERQQLADALTDLRTDLRSARRIPAVIGGALVAGLAVAAVVAAARRRRDDDD